MVDITDIKSIMYTEKTLNQQERGIIVVQTSTRVTKNIIKRIFIDYFGFAPVGINSLRQSGKNKRFKGIKGSRPSYKKFYIKIPDGVKLETLKI